VQTQHSTYLDQVSLSCTSVRFIHTHGHTLVSTVTPLISLVYQYFRYMCDITNRNSQQLMPFVGTLSMALSRSNANNLSGHRRFCHWLSRLFVISKHI